MTKKQWKQLTYAALLMLLFVLFTRAVTVLDVQPIGPGGSKVGLAAVNGFFHRLTGVHFALFLISDWASLLPVGVGLGFALLGLCQWIRRRQIVRVDRDILVLGGYYLAVLFAYLLFESVVINRRPVLMNGYLEASYPSSTTVLVLCVMGTAMQQFKVRIRHKGLKKWVLGACFVYTAAMVLLRTLSGVHWLSDIAGGALLSAALLTAYRALSGLDFTEKKE